MKFLLQSTALVWPRNTSRFASVLLTKPYSQTITLIVTQKTHLPFRILHRLINKEAAIFAALMCKRDITA